MKSPIRILQLEDNPNDALLVRKLLEREGYVCDMMRVENRNDFVAALRDNKFDLVLSDMKLPTFDGLTALQISRQMAPDIPFVIVSGSMGEDAAIESLVNGATDYVLKSRMARLLPAVRRALQESLERKQRMQADEMLREREFWLKESQRVAHLGSYVTDFILGRWTSSEQLDVIFGISQDFDRTVQGWVRIVHPEHREEMSSYLKEIML